MPEDFYGLNFTFWVKAQQKTVRANYAIIHSNYVVQAFEVHNPGYIFSLS